MLIEHTVPAVGNHPFQLVHIFNLSFFFVVNHDVILCVNEIVFFSAVVLCMAASALAPAGPVLCSFISLLSPSEQAQHFKSCFSAAGRDLCNLYYMDRK